MTIQERNKQILEMYCEGKTFEQIGSSFDISRARVQQIMVKEMEKRIANRLDFDIDRMSKNEKEMLKAAANEEVREIYLLRIDGKNEIEKNEIEKKIKEGPDYSNFSSLGKYTKALGVSSRSFKILFPEMYKKLKTSIGYKWSCHYDKCRVCGTTTIKHKCIGLCEKCYPKSDYFKDICEASRMRNKDKWSVKQKEYAKEYSKRPEVKEKYKILNDLKNFDGNREKALIRDDYRCQRCSISQKDSLKKYKKDLFVNRINGKSSDLDNLIAVCQGCHKAKGLKIFNKIAKNRTRRIGRYLLKSSSFGNLKKYQDIINTLDKSLEKRSDDFITLYNKAIYLNIIKKFEEAIKVFDEILKINSMDDDVFNGKGIALYNLKKYKEAIEMFDKALEISPKNKEVLYYRYIASCKIINN